MGADFVRFHTILSALLTIFKVGFLSNMIKIFPSLARRPLYLTGESYAGTYIVRTPLCRSTLINLTHKYD
jgi:hypothetical protein